MNPAIVWFRNDLRVADHPALHAAAASKRPLVCVYLLAESPTERSLGAASRWWLHGSLQALQVSLAKHGGRLTILRGTPTDILTKFATAVNAAAIYWNRRYDAPGRALDDAH